LAAVLAWHFFVASGYSLHQSTPDPYRWGSGILKAQNLLWDVTRYGLGPSSLLLGMFFVTVLLFARGAWSRAAVRNVRVLEPLLLAMTFTVVYIILPGSYSAAGYVDVRTLVFPPLFAMVGVFSLRDTVPEIERPTAEWALIITLTMLLLGVNLAYLGRHLEKDNAHLTAYRTILNDIPVHSRVLPIYTAPPEGVMKPFLHTAEFAVIDRRAFIPYLFSANRGEPMTYFRYLHLPYAPPEEWYIAHPQLIVDWRQVQTEYDFLLVQEPFDLTRVPLQTRVVSEDAAAVLLKILPTHL
jgi:hypothetical protein